MRLALAAALALAACATTPAQTKPQAGNVSTGNDCAVMIAVLKAHYTEPNPRLHIQRGDPKTPGAYRITCDFKAAGIPIEDYDYSYQSTSRENFQGWISLSKPTYAGTLATIETGYLIGPLAGAGQKCTVRSGFAGWTLEKCEQSWIS